MSGPSAPTLPPQAAPPSFAISELLPHAVVGVEVVALPVCPAASGGELVLGPGAADLADALDLDLWALLDVHEATGEAGQVVAHPVAAPGPAHADLRWVLLVGVGAQRPADLRRAGAAMAREVRGRGSVATSIPALAQDALEAFVVGVVLGSFSFHWRSQPPEQGPVGRVILAGLDPADAPDLDRAVGIGEAGWRARTLATVPSHLKSPEWLALQARDLAATAGLGVRVWDEHQLQTEGFGGIVAIGKASATPPRLIRLDYAPADARDDTPTVVLVGKGITFDSGGLSIKPGEGMATMKRDMSGGAVVLATLAALAAVDCPVRVVGLVPAAENAIDGDAVRPGDVVRHYGGRTTEVTNTDAEGRVVLADALAYATSELEPDVVVDVATLTGAMKVALGQHVGGLFANDDALAAVLGDAAARAGEPLWRMPLSSLYEEKLSSSVADADNAPGGPGAIVAALFLQHFVGGVPWAHLDIASVGDSPTDAYEWSAGPTGFGARALLEWLGRPDPLAGIGARPTPA